MEGSVMQTCQVSTLLSVSEYYHNLYHDLIIYELTTLISHAFLESHTTKKTPFGASAGLDILKLDNKLNPKKHLVVEFD